MRRKYRTYVSVVCVLSLVSLAGCSAFGGNLSGEVTCRSISRPASGYVKISRPENTEITYETKCKALFHRYGVTVPDKKPDFNELRKNVNPDVYAWIYLPDTNVNYPVVQHATDNAYYLDYNYDGTKGYPGCIYTENYNTVDFTDPMTIIYGHNMDSGEMFATLFKYTDPQFYESHPYIYIYTEDDVFVYRIISAKPHDDSHIMFSNDFFQAEESLVNYLNGLGISDENIKYTQDSRAVTLSTCVNTVDNQRFLVQGLLLDFMDE